MQEDNTEQIFKLLQIVRVNGNIYFLLNNGFDFNKLMQTLEHLKSLHKIEIDGDNLRLTREGEIYFRKISACLKKRGLYKYLCSDNAQRIIQLSPEEIYIPKKRKNRK